MTFDEYFSKSFSLPPDVPPAARAQFMKEGREMMAACWNAAIDEALAAMDKTIPPNFNFAINGVRAK